MPSTKNPGSLLPGGGIVPPKTVPSVGLITPDRDIAALKAHMNDPTRAHMASAIGIVDAGGYYDSDNVEGALQALPGGVAAGRQNGFVTGGTFTTSGLTVTLDAGSSILLRGMLKDVSGESVTCPVLAGTYNVYFVGTTGSLFAVSGLPDLDDEPVWVAEVTHDGANITGSRDARFFVANIDRKLDYTVRGDSGTAANNEGEACFVTLEAAFFWLENYGSSQDVKRTLLVRGSHTVSATLTLPCDNLEIRGEGDAEITFTGSSALFQGTLSEGLKISGITFICDTGGNPIAISNTSASSGFEVSRCKFLSGTGEWYNAVQLLTDNTRHVIRDCYIEAQNTTAGCAGVYLYGPTECTLENLTVVGPGAATLFTIGLFLGCNPAVHTESKNRVTGCRVSGFAEGIDLWNVGTGTSITDCDISSVVKGAVIYADCDDTIIEACRISPDTTDGLIGVTTAAARTRVQGCDISTARDVTSYGVDEPFGVQFTGTATDGIVSGSTIRNFVSTTATDSAGVFFDGQSGTPTGLVDSCVFENCGVYVYRTDGVTVSNNRLTVPNAFGAIQQRALFSLEEVSDIAILGNVADAGGADGFAYGVLVDNTERVLIADNQLADSVAGIWAAHSNRVLSVHGNIITGTFYATSAAILIEGDAVDIEVSANSIDGYLSATPFEPEATGILIQESSGDSPQRVSVTNNVITRCVNGIVIIGASGNTIRGVAVTGNNVSQCAYAVVPNDSTFAGWGSKGIGLAYVEDAIANSNNVNDIGAVRNDAGTYGIPTGCVSSTGIAVFVSSSVALSDNSVSGLYTQDDGVDIGTYRGIRWSMSTSGTETVGAVITSNTVTPTPDTVVGDDNGFAGIHAYIAGSSTVYNARITSNTVTSRTSNLKHGIFVEVPSGTTAFDGFDISQNRVRNPSYGIVFQNASTTSVYRLQINDNSLYTSLNGILVGESWDPPAASFGIHQSGVSRNHVTVETASNAEHGILVTAQTAYTCLMRDNDVTVTQLGGTAAKKVVGLVCTSSTTSTLQPYTATQIQVEGNGLRFNNSALGLYVEAATTQNLSVSGNMLLINDNAKDFAALRVSMTKEDVPLGTDPTTSTCIIVDRNTISGTISDDGGTMLWLQVGGGLNGGSASHNTISLESDVVMLSSVTLRGIVVNGINTSLAPSSPEWSNVNVDGNTVRVATDALDTSGTPVYPNHGAIVVDLYNVSTPRWINAENLSVSGNRAVSNAATATTGSGLFIGHYAGSGNAWQVTGNSVVGFASTECARMITTSGGAEPTNSVCCNNIAQDGVAPAAGAGFNWGFAVNANNRSY